MKWQFELLKGLSSNFDAANKGISSIPLDLSFDIKRQHLNFSLKKFYRPTINNLSDIANQLLWLADPSTFNDPQDCQLGIDNNFQVYCLDKFAEQCNIFSSREKSQIWNAKRKNKSIYSYNIFPILQLDNRIKLFEDFYHNLTKKVDEYICTLKKTQYRIACFVQDIGNPYEYDNLMWAHYTQDFQGFCVEYDIERIFDFVFNDYSVFDWNSKIDSLNGHIEGHTLKQIIINGLFPVIYSSKQQRISSGNAYKIGIDKINNKIRQETEYNFLKALISKDLIWKYEREWRLIISDEIIKPIGYKIPFPFAKRIIPGRGASRELKSILRIIEDKIGIEREN